MAQYNNRNYGVKYVRGAILCNSLQFVYSSRGLLRGLLEWPLPGDRYGVADHAQHQLPLLLTARLVVQEAYHTTALLMRLQDSLSHRNTSQERLKSCLTR